MVRCRELLFVHDHRQDLQLLDHVARVPTRTRRCLRDRIKFPALGEKTDWRVSNASSRRRESNASPTAALARVLPCPPSGAFCVNQTQRRLLCKWRRFSCKSNMSISAHTVKAARNGNQRSALPTHEVSALGACSSTWSSPTATTGCGG